MIEIRNFTDDYDFLSNFYPSPITTLEWDGANHVHDVTYPTVEHLFQAYKTEDRAARQRIRAAATPGDAKKLGRAAPLRDDWETTKYRFMEHAVREKFSQHPNLAECLTATGDALLVEGNWWHDQVWGDCVCPRHSTPGKNALGIILMRVRLDPFNEGFTHA